MSKDAYRAALRAFGNVAEALGDGKDLDTLLHLIAKRICELAGVPRCSVYLRDDETGLFHGQVGHPRNVGDDRIKRLVAGIPADRFTQEIVESKRPVVVPNALEDPRPIRSTMRAWRIKSMLGVPMVLRGEVIGIVFLDDENHHHAFPPSVCEIASTFADLAAVAISQSGMTSKLRTSVATVVRQNRLLRQAAAMDDRLANLVLEGGDLAEIAIAVAELTGKPTAIHDAQGHRLAAAVPPWFEDQPLPRLLDDEHRDDPAVVAALDGISEAGGGLIGPFPNAGLPQRFLVAPVRTRAQDCGRLVIMEYGSRFGPLDPHIARRAAMNIALEMAAERRAAAAEWDARASLAADLIRGTRDVTSVERRALYLGIDPGAPRVVCLVSGDASAPDGGPTAEAVAAALCEADGDRSVLATGVAEGVLALLEIDADASTFEAISAARTIVERALEGIGDAGVAAALSTRCTDFTTYARGYTEARQVMTCLRTLTHEGSMRVLAADDLGPGRLLIASSNRTEALRFAHDALGPLLHHDDGAPDLLVTLQAFFDSGRSVRRSAAMLGVHENTIRYRLARIEEATGLAAGTSSEDQLNAQLALLVLRLEGTLAPLTIAADA
jgi:sugar diacid utilization regulator